MYYFPITLRIKGHNVSVLHIFTNPYLTNNIQTNILCGIPHQAIDLKSNQYGMVSLLNISTKMFVSNIEPPQQFLYVFIMINKQ